jgi:glycosyltransferase involved in cell wall biosynthesis
VLENGVQTNRIKRFVLPDTSKKQVRVGCVANLRPVKNIDGLMRAAQLALARFPQLVFEVVGDGERRAELERLRAELELGERFVLRGSVPDVPGFLRSVDVAVLPSHSEGMSNALLEYMAAGRAVIATDVGANAKLLDGGRCGLLVPPGDTTALVDALGTMLANPLRAAGYGAAARRRVDAEFSRAAMRKRFESFYKELVGK